MSIASQITALGTDKTDIANAITAKGGTLSQNYGFDTFAADIANIPFASGTVSFAEPTQTFTVASLPFTPKKIFIIGADSRLHLNPTNSVYGSLSFNDSSSSTYKLIGIARNPDNTLQNFWASNPSLFISLQNNGFTISRSLFCFAESTEYFWVACG